MNELTIGQLAGYAGVTIKAVRHYHERGLLPEPPRDASGYRRYGAEHAIALVRIRTLADAGVPLARVQELLGASVNEFEAAIAEIDRNLEAQAERIRRTRERMIQLRAGDRLFVSARVAGYLDRLRELGISERTVSLERDVWILLRAVSPAEADEWAVDKLGALDDPAFCALYRDYDAAFDWQPDDPRLPELASRTRQWFAARPPSEETSVDPTMARVAAGASGASSAAWLRLAELAAQPIT